MKATPGNEVDDVVSLRGHAYDLRPIPEHVKIGVPGSFQCI